MTGFVNLDLYKKAYYILLVFDEISNHKFNPSIFAKKLKIFPDILSDIDTFKNYRVNNLIWQNARETNVQYVPFFGRRCVFGFRTFLKLYLKYKLFPVGHGSNCMAVHGGLVKTPYEIFNHDFNHYTLTLSLNNFNTRKKAEIIFDYCENTEDESYETLAVLYLIIFTVTHEIPGGPTTKSEWIGTLSAIMTIDSDLHGSLYDMLKLGDEYDLRYSDKITDIFFTICDKLGLATD